MRGRMNWRKHVTTWYFVLNSRKTVLGDHGWQIWMSLSVNPSSLRLVKLSNEIMVVMPALKNNGDENKPDKKTIVEQIKSASVIVNGDLKIQKYRIRLLLMAYSFFWYCYTSCSLLPKYRIFNFLYVKINLVCL